MIRSYERVAAERRLSSFMICPHLVSVLCLPRSCSDVRLQRRWRPAGRRKASICQSTWPFLWVSCLPCISAKASQVKQTEPQTPQCRSLSLIHVLFLLTSVQVLISTQRWRWASVHWAKCPGTGWCPTASPSCWGLTLHQGLFTWSITVTVSST